MGCGKLRNQAKIAPGGLPRRENILFSETLFFAKLEQRGFSLNIDVVMHPIAMAPNASEMNEYYPFWVWTHFEYIKTWFGAIILLFYHSLWRRK